MGDEVAQMLGKCKPKITAMLRRRAFYSVKDLVQQFKTHVWPLLESTMGAIFHASTYLLVKIDRLQVSFLKEIGLSEEEAFLQYNVAPLGLRRNIGMLGLLFKIATGQAHPAFNEFFPRVSRPKVDYQMRHVYHELQLREIVLDSRSAAPGVMQRSLFGLVRAFNRLPLEFVDTKSVASFQSGLTEHVRELCGRGDVRWQSCFTGRPIYV